MFENEYDQQNGATSLLSVIVGVVIRAFLAVTTAGFFANYAGDIWAWLLPYPMASYTAAITGVVLVDGLAALWVILRRSAADTEEQQNYAKIGAWLDMALSLIVTGVYVILTTPLLAQSVSYETYAIFVNLASWLGIIVGVVAFAGNGLIWHYYDNASSSSVLQLMRNQLRAIALKGEHELEAERMRLHIAKAQAQIRAQLPQYTQQAANQSAEEYINNRFGQVQQQPLPPAQPKREYTRRDRANFTNGRNGQA